MSSPSTPTTLSKSIDQVIGHLEMIENQQVQRLDFNWHNIPMNAFVEQKENGNIITLKAVLGRVYYTVENSEKRKQALTHIYSSPRVNDGGSYELKNKHEVHFQTKTSTKTKLNSEGLTQALTVILLDYQTELDSVSATLKSLN